MVKSALAAVAIAFVCGSVTIEARVTRIEIAKVERVEPPSSGGQATTQIPYERISGKFYGELDPADPKNALITEHEGYLLDHDAEAMIKQAKASDVLR